MKGEWKLKVRNITAILLCALLLFSLLPTTAATSVNQYYNADYLESSAAAAYSVQNLGATYQPGQTTWKVWSPTAKHVQLRLYATGSDEETGAAVLGTYDMEKDETTGVWSATLSGDHKNVYYTYLVTTRGVTRETRDIYAKAAGVNGKRSMVVDLDATDPTDWAQDHHVLQEDSTDAVIWEVHVRDFSISPSSGVSQENRGKYLAFTEENTTVNNENNYSTCVDYLKEMGVNTVHLLPVYDFGSVDETVEQDWIVTSMDQALSEGSSAEYYRPERNWGYDPVNYNVPEGSYSSNPYDGNTRILEFKEMVQALHNAGISVVMDVVYNHTYDLEDYLWGRVLHNNAFNDTVPGYYFRMSGPLGWINGSGCGNVTASDKLMYRKYMIESVHYWATEYHIDGFRFDLMACHDVETMNLIRADLDALDNGEGQKILMYGEPWDGSFGGGTGISNGATPDNAGTYSLNTRIAMFCSWMRDAIKGDPDGSSKGWVQGESSGSQRDAVYGGLSANDGRLTARSQTVTYADAHDNLILWDKILKSNGSEAWTDYTSAAAQTYLKQLNLAKTIVLMSQGMAFNVAGTEFARTKLGCHNSYKAGDNINAIDWTAREDNAASAAYYKGLIQIRKAFSPITDPVNEYQKTDLANGDENLIAVEIPNQTAGEWSKLLLILNSGSSSRTVTLPAGDWTLISDGIQAGLVSLGTRSGSYTVPSYGSAILVQGTYSGASKAVNASSAETPVRDASDYYLFGYINGANYACESDWQNLGIYKFENGTLTATFTADSYVAVKTGDNANWYMTNGWLGTETTSATLYNTSTLGQQANKLFVPGNVQVTFTLTPGANDTFTLSYTTGGGNDPTPSGAEYYLIGSINGEDYGCESDWENLGSYHFVNGALTATFSSDSYVYVKTGDNANWYMTDGWLGTNVTSATLYNTNDLNDTGSKLYVPGGYEINFSLTEEANDTLTLSYVIGGSTAPSGQAKEAVILHCWNWSYTTIQEQLPAIKAAGYTAVQTSPAQPHSGYKTGTIGVGDWWMLYQPLGLHIAQENESWLGDADDLEALCTAAHELGIEVIVDVVSNHLCNGFNDIESGGTNPYDSSQIIATDANGNHGYQFQIQPDARVLVHNPELTSADFRSDFVFCNDESTEAVVHGNIGMPDLKTENANVQTSVLNYLKELIDVGVDGFRFDAAKHIETPSDGVLQSNFWPIVIGGAESYASEEYDKSIWAYGEVLSTAGKTRKMNYYSPYIDMTEISYAYTITEGFGKDHSASKVANQLFKDWLGIGTETLAASDLVLMAESHDTYAQSAGSFSEYGPEVINKAWAVAVARAGASALYFARPLDYVYGINENDPSAGYPIGTLGACENFNWKNVEVVEANKFHIAFAGSPEAVYAANDLVVVERYNAQDCGAVIANAAGNVTNVIFSAQHLSDGTYYDQITGNPFTVSNGIVSGQMGTTGIVVLRSTAPVTCEHPVEQQYIVTKEATCTEDGYVAVYCQLCGRMVELVSESPALGHIDTDEDKRCDRCNLYLGVVTVYFVDTLDWVPEKDHFTNVNYYAFGTGGESSSWPGMAAELVGRSTDNHGIWKVELNPELYQTIKFIGCPGETEEAKTVNLAFVSDAAALAQDYVVYESETETESSDYGDENLCSTDAVLEDVCGHTAYTYVTVNGSVEKVCDCCGAVLETSSPILDEKLKLYASISIGAEIVVRFSVRSDVLAPYDSFVLTVKKLDREGNVLETKQFDAEAFSSGGIRQVRYEDISAKEMGVEFTAVIHATDSNGKIYCSNTVQKNVKGYVLEELLNSGNTNAVRTLCADMLNYGAAAQNCFGYDTEHLVNEELSLAEQTAMTAYSTKQQAPASKVNSANGPTLYASVSIANRVRLSLNARGISTSNTVKLRVKEHEHGTIVTELDTTKYGSIYRSVFDEIGAGDMRTEYEFVVLDGETETGTPMIWSVEGYVREARLNTSGDVTPEQLALYNALLIYGDSVAAALE